MLVTVKLQLTAPSTSWTSPKLCTVSLKDTMSPNVFWAPASEEMSRNAAVRIVEIRFMAAKILLLMFDNLGNGYADECFVTVCEGVISDSITDVELITTSVTVDVNKDEYKNIKFLF